MFIDPLRPHFAHCPRCARAGFNDGGPALECTGCGFLFYLNAAVAVGGLIIDRRADGSEHLLVIRRAKEPAQGKLAVPGGFVDKNETAEAALAREVREEVGLEVTAQEYLLSHPNSYEFRGVTYTVLDFFYLAQVRSFDVVLDQDEVSGWQFAELATLDLEEIAFPSMRAAVRAARHKKA